MIHCISFGLYFTITGLHALHVLIGMGLILWLIYRVYNNSVHKEYFTPVEMVGLYWHLVDVVWIFFYFHYFIYCEVLKMAGHFIIPKKYYQMTFVALLILTVLTVLISRVDLGILNTPVAILVTSG